MGLEQKNKADLIKYCEDNGIALEGDETKKVILEKIENQEVEAETEDKVEVVADSADTEEVVEEQENDQISLSKATEDKTDGKVSVKYKSKQRWIELGEFDSKEAALKVLKRKGAKLYEIK